MPGRFFLKNNWLWFVLLAAVMPIVCGCGGESKPDKPAAPQTDPPSGAVTSDAEKPSVPADLPTPLTPSDGTKPMPKDEPPKEGDAATSAPSSPGDSDKPATEMPGPNTSESGTAPPASEEPQRPQAAKLPQPLVENVEKLVRLDPDRPLWLDKDNKRVVMVGQVCQTNVPLEMFACISGTKEHESVVSVDVKAFAVHAALLALGATPGRTVEFQPEYKPAAGPEIEVTVMWKDDKGEIHTARGQDWVRNQKTGKAMEHPWVFAGSRFFEDEVTKQKIYMAEGGDFICVSNFPSAMLDLPVASPQDNAELIFETFTERIPPRGTPVTLILTPKLDAKDAPQPIRGDQKDAPVSSDGSVPSVPAPAVISSPPSPGAGEPGVAPEPGTPSEPAAPGAVEPQPAPGSAPPVPIPDKAPAAEPEASNAGSESAPHAARETESSKAVHENR